MKMMYLFLVLVVGTTSGFLGADDDVSSDQIRRMVEDGEILSLEAILAQYPEKIYGKLLDLEVEREHRIVVYELEFLRSDGRVIELEIDARNGQLLEQEIED
ncbi:MAG: peptidase M4 [Gammaproteobacteria bacterium]|nr:peptidase M4 [Gammaproteobacteria bacterium]